jgi:hypothetical protein
LPSVLDELPRDDALPWAPGELLRGELPAGELSLGAV